MFRLSSLQIVAFATVAADKDSFALPLLDLASSTGCVARTDVTGLTCVFGGVDVSLATRFTISAHLDSPLFGLVVRAFCSWLLIL